MDVKEAKELRKDVENLSRKIDRLNDKVSGIEIKNSHRDSNIDNLYKENKQILKAISKQSKKNDKKTKYIYKRLAESDDKLEKVNMRWNLVVGGATVLLFLMEYLDLSKVVVR